MKLQNGLGCKRTACVARHNFLHAVVVPLKLSWGIIVEADTAWEDRCVLWKVGPISHRQYCKAQVCVSPSEHSRFEFLNFGTASKQE